MGKEMSTKLTFENEFGKYTVEVSDDEMTLNAVMGRLVAPVLFAAQYSDELVRNFIPEGTGFEL